ncbi:hypothetical protein GJAV_G00156030 [Gymnothorax javanicus]|nr:hypothetical protein GJAV_G00156030 [Gymnothorax javanicus]
MKTYQLIVNGLKGEKMSVDVGNSEEEMNSLTVLQLKKRIAEKMPGKSGDSLDDLRLIFTHHQLDDESRLSKYGIQDKSIIQLVLKLPGGRWARRS